jgi:hypothetical protein
MATSGFNIKPLEGTVSPQRTPDPFKLPAASIKYKNSSNSQNSQKGRIPFPRIGSSFGQSRKQESFQTGKSSDVLAETPKMNRDQKLFSFKQTHDETHIDNGVSGIRVNKIDSGRSIGTSKSQFKEPK